MDKYFALFGKTVLVVMVVTGLIGGGIYLDRFFIHKPPAFLTPTPSTSTAVTPTSVVSVPTPTVVPTHFAVSGGGKDPFVAYTLSAISGWNLTKENTNIQDKVILTQGNYQLTILQAAIGGGGCTFPGQAPAQMSVALTDPIDIPLLTGVPLRRGTAQSANANQMSYTICQKGSDGSYGTLTTYGAITYTTPLNPDLQVLAQMDGMVGSLQKQ